MIEGEKKGEEEEQAGSDRPVSEREAPAEAEEPTDAEGLRARLEEEKSKAEGYLANWQRAAADYQNFKRRVEQERQETARLSNAALIINVLPLLDDLERALTTVDARLASLTWVDGIRLIYRKFQAVL
ncbi:MAG: nucleotide exchange factor GrpE, partial [Candidatus Bathyarchaeota archaeon]|nr:nucleotide exchange factor GrpE [Candidatus Bathyarchaeota archaeon]